MPAKCMNLRVSFELLFALFIGKYVSLLVSNEHLLGSFADSHIFFGIHPMHNAISELETGNELRQNEVGRPSTRYF